MEATITTKNRNLGFAYTALARQDGTGGLYVPAPTAPDTHGGLAMVERELHQARRNYGYGTYWSFSFFVDGRQVEAFDSGSGMQELRRVADLQDLIALARAEGCRVRLSGIRVKEDITCS